MHTCVNSQLITNKTTNVQSVFIRFHFNFGNVKKGLQTHLFLMRRALTPH